MGLSDAARACILTAAFTVNVSRASAPPAAVGFLSSFSYMRVLGSAGPAIAGVHRGRGCVVARADALPREQEDPARLLRPPLQHLR